MKPDCKTLRRKPEGFTRSFNRYEEKRWKQRFKPTTISFSSAATSGGNLQYLCEFCHVIYFCHGDTVAVATEQRSQDEEDQKKADWLARLYIRADQVFICIPVVLFIGALVAALFSIFGIGPAWAGFLVGAVPTSGLATWIYADSVK